MLIGSILYKAIREGITFTIVEPRLGISLIIVRNLCYLSPPSPPFPVSVSRRCRFDLEKNLLGLLVISVVENPAKYLQKQLNQILMSREHILECRAIRKVYLHRTSLQNAATN